MKTIKLSDLLNIGPVFQGDLMLSADKLPVDAKQLDTDIIAHSETEHNHVAKYAQVLGGLDPMVMFLKPAPAAKKIDGVPYIDIVHERSFDTHEPIRLLFDIDTVVPRVDRQEEFTPDGWRVVAD